MLGGGEVEVDVKALKEAAIKIAPEIKDEKDYDRVETELLKKLSKPVNLEVESKGPAVAPAAPEAAPPADKKVAKATA